MLNLDMHTRARVFRFALGLIAACCVPTPLQAAKPDQMIAFVVLSAKANGEQVALARIVIEQKNAPCPSLAPAGSGSRSLAMTPRRNPDPAHFGVTVCEALYPTDGAALSIAGTSIRLPGVPRKVSRVVVFGDTGCDLKEQGCAAAGDQSSKDWPFSAMADAVAKADPAPDLVLHMGDYNYRGTPGKIKVNGTKVRVYDAGDNAPATTCTLKDPYFGQNSKGSDLPDSWKAWKNDFFQPAAKLLGAAPWILARGNHELCSRAGPGWFYLLDSRSDLLGQSDRQLSCPPAESADPLIFGIPYRVDVGGLSVVVLDSANACDQGSLHQEQFNAQFKQIQPLVANAPAANAVWLQSHRPLWGVKKADNPSPGPQPDASVKDAVINQTLQAAYAGYPVPKRLHLVLSGHMHRFQSIAFEPSSGLPTQLVVGNGGVDLAANYPADPFSLKINGARAVGFGLSEFGFMEIELTADGGWTGHMIDDTGHSRATCASHNPWPEAPCAAASK